MPRHTLPVVLFLMLVAGGCARTDDGTVVIPETLDMRRADLGPLDLRHWGRMRPAETRPTVLPAPPETFPISPQAKAVGRRTDRTPNTRRYRSKSAAVDDASASGRHSEPLSCEPAKQAGKRVRVLCE